MAYLGGKGNCYSQIIGMMPSHRVYIETHLGGGAVMRAKRPAMRQIGVDIDEKVIEAWRQRAAPCELIQDDAVAFLARYSFVGDEVVYCDPPYPLECRNERNRYRHEYNDDDHATLLDVLLSLKCRVLISGQPTALYNDRLAKWRCVSFNAAARRGMRRELLWMNFAEPEFLSDPLKSAGGFRERERIKRRLKTMQKKVDQMTGIERSLFFDWIAENYPEQIARFERATT